MTGFELGISGVESDRSTNCATTAAQDVSIIKIRQTAVRLLCTEIFAASEA